MEIWEICGDCMKLKILLQVLSSASGFSIFALSFVVSFLVLLFTSGLVLFPKLELNPFAELWMAPIIGLISLLFSFNMAVFLNNFSFQIMPSKSGAFGAAAGLLTTTCPVCSPVLIGWLGLGSIFGVLSTFNFYIGVLSVGLLGYSLWSSLYSYYCRVKKHGKGD